ncbi:MAG: GNAT family N-acetyltransferase, partial [Armatimonadota bacterium]
MPGFHVRQVGPDDRGWVAQFITNRWGADRMVAHGAVYRPAELPGFVALEERERVGLLTYQVEGPACEIVSLDSTRPSRGVGSALIEAIKEAARRSRCSRVWLVTTNDNLNALRFYQ